MPKPAFSPIKKEILICHTCSNVLRPKVNSMPNGRFVSLAYYCDTCKYGLDISVDYASGMEAKYEPPEERVTESRIPVNTVQSYKA